MKPSSSAGKYVNLGLGILATLVVLTFLFSITIPSLHNITPSIVPISLVVLGGWFIFGGVRKIGQARKNTRDIPWYKQPLLTGGMASLLFGLNSWLVFLASFLPDFLRNSVEVALVVVLLIPAFIFLLLSIFNFIKRELDADRIEPIEDTP